MTSTPKPANVIEALARIMEELPAIAKKKHPTADGQGVSYPYRGIEEITAEAQGLFGKYGVVPIPYKTVPVETREFQVKSGATWTDEKIEIHWRIYGPGGVDDMIEAQTLGIGRDNSDKGFNKGATQALKYLLLPMLLVADPKDDADGTTQEADAGAGTTRRSPAARQSQESTGDVNGDIATMDLRTLTAALEAANLPLTGTTEAKRLRLAEHRSGVAPANVDTPPTGGGITQLQIGKLEATLTEKGFPEDRDERHAYMAKVVGHEVWSVKDLTKAEGSKVIEAAIAEPVREPA